MHSKPLPFLLIVLISLAACQHKKPAASPAQTIKPRSNPDSAWRFNSLEPHEVLNRLFDSPDIKGDTAIWKPNFSETMSSFQLSYDDSCHTAIDTVLYFKDHDSTNCAVIVSATYRYSVDSLDGMKIKIGDCHSCGATVGMALFSQDTDRRWYIYAFNKSLTVSGDPAARPMKVSENFHWFSWETAGPAYCWKSLSLQVREEKRRVRNSIQLKQTL
jgi:hypothetical protein